MVQSPLERDCSPRSTARERRDQSQKDFAVLDLSFEHDLIRPSFARRSGLREGGKPVSTFRDHALKFFPFRAVFDRGGERGLHPSDRTAAVHAGRCLGLGCRFGRSGCGARRSLNWRLNWRNFAYQWQNLAAGQTVWNDISSATGSTYQVQHGDIGDQLRVEVGFTDTVTSQTAAAFSAPTFDVAPCYCPGTLIRTKGSETRVEKLKIGDKVMTKSGVARPIKWIGRRSYGGRFILGRKDILPVCVKAGALDDNVPRRDLWISPHHAMYLDGILIEAKDLINGVSIVQAERVEKVEYFHIELDTHDVIIAERALSESFIDDDSRAMFHNAHEYRALYPDAPSGPVTYCAPRLEDGYEVEAARRRIMLRAGLLRPADAPRGRKFARLY
jgi:hypothetical protein